jgi:hypothetical protein
MGKLSILLWVGVVLAGVARRSVSPRRTGIDPKDLIGTWEWVSLKNLKTGEVDSTAKHQTAWVSYTGTHNLYVSMEKDRPALSRAEFERLSPEERIKANYRRVWNEKNQTVFTGIATTYTVQGNTITYTTRIALNPNQLGRVGSETIARLAGDTLIIHRPPNADGAVLEETWRRLH